MGSSSTKPAATSEIGAGDVLLVRSDLNRYRGPQAIWVALLTGHVRLLKASYLVKLAREGQLGVLRRRQELPDEAFVSVKELQKLYGMGNIDGVLPIISISFCWDTAPHPDPRGKQLATVAAALEREMPKYAELGFTEMGVFWDWASIHQKDPRLFDPSETPEAKPEGPERDAFVAAVRAGRSFYGGAAYEASRSEEEKAAFRYALHETMDLWYAHQGTTVYMLTELPEGTTRKAGYDDSGWTTYERRSAEQIKKVRLYAAHWKLVLDVGAGDHEKGRFEAGSRNWPLDPDGFDDLIEGKQFTNGADKGAVKALFRKMSVAQLGGIKEINFLGLSSPTVAEAQQLGRCLSLCHQLEGCHLDGVQMTDDACVALFSSLASGSLGALQYLYLHENNIGDEGIQALASAIASGSVANLWILRLERNQIGDAGMSAFAGAIASGSLGNLRKLGLNSNRIGDPGMSALAGAIASGSMASLETLALNENKIGDAGVSALAGAIANGSLGALTFLSLSENNISDDGMKAFAEAVANGSLVALKTLHLNRNEASESGKDAIKKAAEERSIECII